MVPRPLSHTEPEQSHERTVGYESAVAEALTHAGSAVVVVNPRQARDCARSTGKPIA